MVREELYLLALPCELPCHALTDVLSSLEPFKSRLVAPGTAPSSPGWLPRASRSWRGWGLLLGCPWSQEPTCTAQSQSPDFPSVTATCLFVRSGCFACCLTLFLIPFWQGSWSDNLTEISILTFLISLSVSVTYQVWVLLLLHLLSVGQVCIFYVFFLASLLSFYPLFH